MATRSTIWHQEEDGSFKGCYCHYDGYLSNNGKILLTSYNTFEKVKELVSRGGMSSLESDISKINFYADEGEELNVFHAFSVITARQSFEEYNYFFIDGVWKYSLNDKTTLYELTEEPVKE